MAGWPLVGFDGAHELVPATAALVQRYTVGLFKSGPYRPPSDAEIGRLPALVEALASADATALVAAATALGLSVVESEGRLVLVPAEPGLAPWLLLVVTPDVVPTSLVEVPHPYADLHTESAALAVAARHPSGLLLQAGAHRLAGAPASARQRVECPADVSSRPDALFSRLALGLVERLGVSQVQWHGFADRGEIDVVASPGSATPGPLLAAATAELASHGLRVVGPDDPRVADLAGRRNVQGRAAADHGTEFVHLELSRSVRDDRDRLAAAAAAVAEALASLGDRECPPVPPPGASDVTSLPPSGSSSASSWPD